MRNRRGLNKSSFARGVIRRASVRHVIAGLDRAREQESEGRAIFVIGITRTKDLVVFSIAKGRPKSHGAPSLCVLAAEDGGGVHDDRHPSYHYAGARWAHDRGLERFACPLPRRWRSMSSRP